ncbi:MAG: DNA starvation/stationary phase protection protein [Chitinophaga sp.]|uniref:Dps family protein n=1 Tax=Chitinophaga sp. TaxID=1869181 RepID=UPI0025BB9B91|nr:DNA starvation/stationary phase protection protein [Chitinophaga sp.]MBV8254623.1 DNA starvation/stationary phase protection protein [Chitinophaga sp.]
MKVNTGILPEHAQQVALELNKVLADEMVLYAKTRNCHWNIEGPSFKELHVFFEEQYEELEEYSDEVAERIRAIGHYALGRMVDALSLTHLLEEEYTNDPKKQLQSLLADHETIIRNLRNLIEEFDVKYKDQGSSDFVTGLMRNHEKIAWMIRSYLK